MVQHGRGRGVRKRPPGSGPVGGYSTGDSVPRDLSSGSLRDSRVPIRVCGDASGSAGMDSERCISQKRGQSVRWSGRARAARPAVSPALNRSSRRRRRSAPLASRSESVLPRRSRSSSRMGELRDQAVGVGEAGLYHCVTLVVSSTILVPPGVDPSPRWSCRMVTSVLRPEAGVWRIVHSRRASTCLGGIVGVRRVCGDPAKLRPRHGCPPERDR